MERKSLYYSVNHLNQKRDKFYAICVVNAFWWVDDDFAQNELICYPVFANSLSEIPMKATLIFQQIYDRYPFSYVYSQFFCRQAGKNRQSALDPLKDDFI